MTQTIHFTRVCSQKELYHTIVQLIEKSSIIIPENNRKISFFSFMEFASFKSIAVKNVNLTIYNKYDLFIYMPCINTSLFK